MSIRNALAGSIAAGTKVTVRGWVRTRRDSKAGLSFVQLNDGSCFDNIQLVANRELENYQSEILRLNAGCSIIAGGTLVKSKGRGQAWEIQVENIDVVGWVDDPDTYPIQQKKHTFEYLREMAHLRPRTNTFGAVTRVRHQVAMAVHRYFHDNDYYWIHTPIVTAADAEGAGELFRVSTLDLLNLPRSKDGDIDFGEDFFDTETFLTVSGQLNVECYCQALTKVYTFGPTFRAENSNTSRHLAEFWMIEPEIAFADLNDLADLAEDFLKYIAADVLEHRADDMRFFEQRIEPDCIKRLKNLIESRFERLDYGETVEILAKSGRDFEFPVEWGRDLQTEHERYLCEEHVGRPVIVLNYPKHIKPFYMRLNDDAKTVAALDVLAPGIGEIIGGSQREERLEYLDRRLDEMDTKESLWWYRDLRRYGTVPHAGFGLGFDRLINYITGMANIRDVIPFPRTPGSAPF